MTHLYVLLGVLLVAVAALSGVIVYLRMHQKDTHDYREENIPAPKETAAIDQYLYDRCCRYMIERRPFLVDSFTLQDLANAVYTNKVYLSRTISRFSGKNFRQYVNYYRVMYAMELFRKNMGLRVQDLAGLAGFHSQTVFLRNFKLVMGEQPSQWCARVRKKYNRIR